MRINENKKIDQSTNRKMLQPDDLLYHHNWHEIALIISVSKWYDYNWKLLAAANKI